MSVVNFCSPTAATNGSHCFAPPILMLARMMAVSPSPYAVPVKSLPCDVAKMISLPGGRTTEVGVTVLAGKGEIVDSANGVDVDVMVGMDVATDTEFVQLVSMTLTRKMIHFDFTSKPLILNNIGA